jgi:hypothetical protein
MSKLAGSLTPENIINFTYGHNPVTYGMAIPYYHLLGQETAQIDRERFE